MQGMFRGNGGCGYVKKPEFLIDGGQFDPKAELPVKKTLKVKVYLGDGWRMDFKQTHFDSYSPPDFYCKVLYLHTSRHARLSNLFANSFSSQKVVCSIQKSEIIKLVLKLSQIRLLTHKFRNNAVASNPMNMVV